MVQGLHLRLQPFDHGQGLGPELVKCFAVRHCEKNSPPSFTQYPLTRLFQLNNTIALLN
jgi:hypothetical protein